MRKWNLRVLLSFAKSSYLRTKTGTENLHLACESQQNHVQSRSNPPLLSRGHCLGLDKTAMPATAIAMVCCASLVSESLTD